MNIDIIREFLVLADTGKYEEAAFSLFITQSTLSKHILFLEYSLGGKPLFIRGRDSTQLTEYGKKFYIYAKRILELYDGFLESSTTDTKDARTLHIGVAAGIMAYGIYDIIKAFSRMHPETEIFLEDERIDKKLHSGDLDIGILLQNLSSLERETVPLFSDRLVPVVYKGHPLEGKKVSLEDLKDEEFVMLPRNIFIGQECIRFCLQNGFKPNIMHTVSGSSINTMLQLVSAKWGITLVPEQEARYWDYPGTCILDIEQDHEIFICIQYEKSHILSDSEKEFIDHVKIMTGNMEF